MRKMLFQNTEHSDTHATIVTPLGKTATVYSTVRRGVKWTCLSVGEEIELADVQGHVVHRAMVADVHVMRFCDLALHPDLILTNYDKNCRRYQMLLRRMEAVYPKPVSKEAATVEVSHPGFVSEEIVTVVAYTLL